MLDERRARPRGGHEEEGRRGRRTANGWDLSAPARQGCRASVRLPARQRCMGGAGPRPRRLDGFRAPALHALHMAGPRAGRFRAAADSAGPLCGKGSGPDVRGRTAGRADEKSVKPRWLLSQEMAGGGGTQGLRRFSGVDFLCVPGGAGVCGAGLLEYNPSVSTSKRRNRDSTSPCKEGRTPVCWIAFRKFVLLAAALDCFANPCGRLNTP